MTRVERFRQKLSKAQPDLDIPEAGPAWRRAWLDNEGHVVISRPMIGPAGQHPFFVCNAHHDVSLDGELWRLGWDAQGTFGEIGYVKLD